jgi:hypothetical protein
MIEKLVEVIILILITEIDLQKSDEGNYQRFAKRDLYSELIFVSTSNLQKHWYFSDFMQIKSKCINKNAFA